MAGPIQCKGKIMTKTKIFSKHTAHNSIQYKLILYLLCTGNASNLPSHHRTTLLHFVLADTKRISTWTVGLVWLLMYRSRYSLINSL